MSDWVTVGALAVAAALGFGGIFAPAGSVQDLLYALSAAGLVLGAVLLALYHLGTGLTLAAVGFAVLALAAVPFAVHATMFFGGATLETDGPAAPIGYTLLTVAIVGWIITVLRGPSPQAA